MRAAARSRRISALSRRRRGRRSSPSRSTRSAGRWRPGPARSLRAPTARRSAPSGPPWSARISARCWGASGSRRSSSTAPKATSTARIRPTISSARCRTPVRSPSNARAMRRIWSSRSSSTAPCATSRRACRACASPSQATESKTGDDPMTRTRLSTALRIGTAVAALAGAAPAWAQEGQQPPAGAPDPARPTRSDAPAEDADNAATIVVTARRRAETLLNVPIAVTAFTGAQLENEGARDITELANTTPNVTLETTRGTNTTLSAFIRGIGQQDPVAGFEQGVGIYVDDVYLNRPQAAVLEIYDVERIEVLRGPQGTLYGRNTIGGAVKYVTRRLSDHPAFHFRGDLGTYSQADAVASASMPLGPVLRVGASLARLSRGGFGKNFTTGL